MKIFDSLKNNKWLGKGFDLKQNSLLILKSADFSHFLDIKSGKYKIKILGKKRTGSGKITLEIIGDDKDFLFKREINFSNNSWSEFSFDFESQRIYKEAKIRISRDKNVYGSLEVGRIFLDLAVTVDPEVINGKRRKFNKMDKTKILVNDLLISDENKKIAFIVPYHIYGGAEVYIQNIINEIDTRHQITVLYLKENQLQNYTIGSNINHRVIKNLDQLRGVVKSSEFDFIVYYNRADVYNLLNEMKKQGETTSSLIEIYHSDFAWAGSLSMLKQRESIDKFITVSKSLGLDIDGISERKREVVPVGIDLQKFSYGRNEKFKNQVGAKGFKAIIGTVARLSKEKQIDYVLKLAKLLPEYFFVIVGDGPEENYLRNIIKENNLVNVNLVGFQKNVAEFYKIFDAFILTSKMEGTPISILEAMASEVLVFSNMVGAIPDIIEEGVTGFGLKQNYEEDAEIIKNNLGNFEVLNNARSFVEENHDIKKNSHAFIKALFSIKNFFKERPEDRIKFLPGQYI